jgi:hypothetical protein
MPYGGSVNPNRAIPADQRVVRAVEPLAAIPVGQHGHGPVLFGAGHLPVALLTGDKAALSVNGGAVG